MTEERPYSANYSIGFMFVVCIYYVLCGVCSIVFPDYYSGIPGINRGDEEVGFALALIILAILTMLYCGIPFAHKLSLMILLPLSVVNLHFVSLLKDVNVVDVISSIAFVSSVVLLVLKPCREYYEGWGFCPNHGRPWRELPPLLRCGQISLNVQFSVVFQWMI